MSNSVEVSSTGQVLVTQVAEQAIEVSTGAAPITVEIATEGPQGPIGSLIGLGDLTDVNDVSKVDKSVLYYDSATSTWRGNDINTVISLTDGGAF